jgi:hypothetical protein
MVEGEIYGIVHLNAVAHFGRYSENAFLPPCCHGFAAFEANTR